MKKQINPNVLVEKDGATIYKSPDENGGKRTMFLTMHCGNAKGKNGVTFDLSTGLGSGAPIVTNTKTGRILTLSWQGILDIGEKLGLMDKVAKKRSKK